MKKVLALGMLGLLVAFAMALGTSATFRDYRAQRSVHVDVVADDVELIDLHPGQPYAYLNERGMLVIDFSADNPNWPGYTDPNWTGGLGISPQSRYNFDHVFYVSNHLWEQFPIVVRIVSSHPGRFSFYDPTENMWVTDGYAQPYNSDTAAGDVCFILQPGEELGVGMEVSGFGEVGLGDFHGNVTIMAWPLGEEPFECRAGGVVG
ncbi:MAG: hypothetical protein PWP49_1787 [Thermococcaceae archaeon]|uniref:DUF1102 domain-containing protein n=2 Tax=Thermococcus TaxID=2263 RepID=A0A101EK21_9EURY|nr:MULTISPECIES: DUF1102 domain-containing protein [Thermococcus]KUK16827.1 MAG: Uncharacterized protein XD54_1878 [Thermococcus sibiricus]MDK2783589.1 hypothetical protein [Thermococcaceae archaeon]MDN5321367.1 hypothetical protein [Thermococcaceae archaeon]